MSEMFNLHDQIFLQDVKDVYDIDKISDLTKKYLESNASVEEKKYFLILKSQYFEIKNIKDYKEKQQKMYAGKSKNEIILLEITRILNNKNIDPLILSQIADIKYLLRVYSSNLPDELYSKLIDIIIRIEISLGMKIGLFDELCNMFEKMLDNTDNNQIILKRNKMVNVDENRC